MKIAGTSLKPLEIWRDDVSLSEARSFGSSLFTSFVRGARGAQVGRLGPRPQQALILYSIETCPFSRLVREALSELDIDVLIKPCPKNEPVYRAELERLSGQQKVPYLVDPNRNHASSESNRLVAYLFRHYGDGRVPAMLNGGSTAMLSSKLASQARGGVMHYEAPALMPERPLELYGYEASPYCRFVREQLDALGIAYLTRNLARNSRRRIAFEKEHGKLQFPYLFDPNTDKGLFETGAILTYLDESYKQGHVPAAQPRADTQVSSPDETQSSESKQKQSTQAKKAQRSRARKSAFGAL